MTSYVLIHRPTLIDDDKMPGALCYERFGPCWESSGKSTANVGCGRSKQCVCHVLVTECTLS